MTNAGVWRERVVTLREQLAALRAQPPKPVTGPVETSTICDRCNTETGGSLCVYCDDDAR